MAQLPRAVPREAELSPPEAPDTANESFADGAAQQHLAWLARAARGKGRDNFRYLLAARFALVNLAAFSLVGVAWAHGLIGTALAADRTRLVIAIAAVFLAGLALCAAKVITVSRQINRVRDFDPLVPSRAAEYLGKIRGLDGGGRGMVAAAMRLKLTSRIQVVRQIANSLVVLGLIGTVIGFIIALSGVDPAAAGKPETIAPMVGRLIEGMSVALYTTLVGAALNLWLSANYQILANGTANLVAGLMEFGESHART